MNEMNEILKFNRGDIAQLNSSVALTVGGNAARASVGTVVIVLGLESESVFTFKRSCDGHLRLTDIECDPNFDLINILVLNQVSCVFRHRLGLLE